MKHSNLQRKVARLSFATTLATAASAFALLAAAPASAAVPNTSNSAT